MFAPHSVRAHQKVQRPILIFATVLVVVGVLALLMRKPEEPISLSTCSTTSVAEQYAAADLVLNGEVFLVVPDGAENAKVLITPDRLYKGDLPATGIAIAAKAGSDGMESDVTGELHFASGQPPYLLYLEERADGLFTTSRCLGSRLLGEGLTNEEQLILGVGQAPT